LTVPGLLLHSPADILRRLLVSLGLGTLPSAGGAWPVYAPEFSADAPDNAIVVKDTAGRTHGRTMPDGQRQGQDGAQIMVRAKDHVTGYPKAIAIAIALNQSVYDAGVTVGAARYLVHSVYCGDVLGLGKDDPTAERNLFTVNALLDVDLLS
jgi:hypothetical protein